MEASITLNLSGHSKYVLDALAAFQQIGWNIYNPEGKAEYIPLGDRDHYDWQSDEMSESAFFDLAAKKLANKEPVVVNLFFEGGKEGVTFLAEDTENILLNLSIHHRRARGRNTDMAWYWQNIICRFLEADIRVLSYTLAEVED